ncbi:hypothetical protein Tco_0598915 [Tanacetum coccineum]
MVIVMTSCSNTISEEASFEVSGKRRTSKYGESNTYVLEDLTLIAGNHVKEDNSIALQPHSGFVTFIATCSYSSFKDTYVKDESSIQTKIIFRKSDNQEQP